MITRETIVAARAAYELTEADWPDEAFRTIGGYAVASDYPDYPLVIAHEFSRIHNEQLAATAVRAQEASGGAVVRQMFDVAA
jgi:hypothetical protein